jgi:hypothetical protein
MRSARTKDELMIEVWEELDCENVGAAEIEAIENAVRERFGPAAVDSPMAIARLLADEGAELRHSEIMQLWVERNSDRPYDAVFRNILQFAGFRQALSTIRNLENLRRKYTADGDKEGLRLVRETALRGKKMLEGASSDKRSDEIPRSIAREILQWLTVWLQNPEMFADWVELRRRSADFIAKFGTEGSESQ